MADKKRTYTNADLVQRTPMTVTTKREATPVPKARNMSRDAQLLEEALAQGLDANAILRGASAFANSRHAVDAGNDEKAAFLAQMQAERDSRIGPVVKRTVDAMSIPLSILPNPVQPIASSYLALQGIENAVEDPSLMNIAGAGLSAVPLAATLRKGKQVVEEVPELLRKSRYIDKRLRQTKPSEGGTVGVGSRMDPMPIRGPQGVQYGQTTPNRPTTSPGQAEVAHTPPQKGWWASINALLPETSLSPPKGPTPGILPDDILERMNKPPVNGPWPSPMRNSVAAMDDVAERADREWWDTLPIEPKVRPDVHPAQTDGGKFGFDDLPEISDSELTRIQQMMKRLGF